MIALYRTACVICAVLVETVAVLALVAIGRRSDLVVPVGHLDQWLRGGDPATVVVALLRWVALLGAGWLLGSTLLYIAASVSRAPGAVRAVRWSTLPAVRRAVDAACAVSVATSVVLAPAAAGARRASDPPTTPAAEVLVRDGRGGGLGGDGLGPPVPRPAAPAPEIAASPSPAVDVIVAPGDNLWALAAGRLAAASGRAPADVADDEVARYWLRVCEANRDRLVSRDPNLVFPGERVVLPPV